MARAEDDTEIERQNWHWRNSMRPVRFFNLDARAALPFCLLLFYARPITLLVTIVVTMIFYYLERKGLTFPAALRSLRVWLTGQDKYGWVALRHRKSKDYG
jgi:intracellular multiplication protein IcmT